MDAITEATQGGEVDVRIHNRLYRYGLYSLLSKCGEQINVVYADGTGKCDSCGLWFGVVECEEGEE